METKHFLMIMSLWKLVLPSAIKKITGVLHPHFLVKIHFFFFFFFFLGYISVLLIYRYRKDLRAVIHILSNKQYKEMKQSYLDILVIFNYLGEFNTFSVLNYYDKSGGWCV